MADLQRASDELTKVTREHGIDLDEPPRLHKSEGLQSSLIILHVEINFMKKLIVFDLDGTLASSKSPLDDEMANLLDKLLKTVKVAVISGGDWSQFQKQVLSHLGTGDGLTHSCGLCLASYKPRCFPSDEHPFHG